MCSKGIAKCFLVLFNVLFLLVGGLLLAVGIIFLQDSEELLDKVPAIPMIDNVREILEKARSTAGDLGGNAAESLLTNCAYVLIAIGAFLFLYGFLGCVGACKESKCLLYLYAICVAVILLFEAAVIILVVVYMPRIETEIKKYMTESITMAGGYKGISFKNQSLEFPTDPVSIAWDAIHTTVECCGVTNSSQFVDLEWKLFLPNGSQAQVPISCCSVITPSLLKDLMTDPTKIPDINDVLSCILTPDESNSHQIGCYDKLKDMIDQYLYFCIGITAGIFLIEILAIVAACSIAKADKDK